jgi:putative ABC transport system permease protein
MARMSLVVCAKSDPLGLAGTIRAQILAVDKDQPVYDMSTMEQRLSRTLAPSQFNLLLMSIFASAAVLLAVVGVYGLIAHLVSQRSHEFGIRIALGAQPRDILKLVLSKGLVLTLLGVGIGLAASLALTRFLSTLLFDVSATDPLTFISISVLLASVALFACYIPARRATRVDPMAALKYE